MTTRVRHLTVILDEDYHEDNLGGILGAIYMIKGVEHVQSHVVDGNANLATIVAKADLKRELLKKLMEILEP